MTLEETLLAVWQQTLAEGKTVVELESEHYPLRTTRVKKLRSVEFMYGPYRIDGIEQNPQTGSRWAMLARQGNRVMQFSYKGRYIGNVCEGKLIRYPAWRALDLPS